MTVKEFWSKVELYDEQKIIIFKNNVQQKGLVENFDEEIHSFNFNEEVQGFVIYLK